MDTAIIIAIISIIGNLIMGLLQIKEYKAKAVKTETEALSITEEMEMLKEKQIFDQLMLLTSTTSLQLKDCEDRKAKILKELDDKDSKIDKLFKERVVLLKKIRETDPNYKIPAE